MAADPSGPMTEPCEECRFDPATMAPAGPASPVVDEIAALARKIQAPLTRTLPGEDGATLLRTRPAPDVWSPLEYACHVRDVLVRFEERTRAMVAEPGVAFGWWDHEAEVETADYQGQDATVVAGEVAAAATAYADTLRGLADGDWSASGERNPGEIFTVHSLAVYGLHEARHHLLDIGRGLRAARGR